MTYPEFKQRYNIIAAQIVAKAKNDKAAANGLLEKIQLDKEKYRCGHTKVFFRAGILGFMEEVREDRIGSVLAWLQAGARGKSSRMAFKKLQDQKLALYCVQRAIRNRKIATTWKWMEIWYAIKPNLKCTQFSKYKAEFESKIALAESNIDKALEDRAKVQKVHDELMAAKMEVQNALEGGANIVQDMMDKTKRIENQAAEVEKQISDLEKRVKNEQQVKQNLEQQMQKITSQVAQIQGEVSNLERAMNNSIKEREVKDQQIQALREEIAHQADMIAKLQKEKKSVGDTRQRSEEDIQSMEDKCNHLSKVKGKLEQALDEAEDSLEREKKVKSEVEKMKRKIEGDLKLTQESLGDLERARAELNQTVSRKEKEYQALAAKIEDEGSLGNKYQKQIKELQSRLEEIDEELQIERGNRAKAEKSRAVLRKDIDDIVTRLDEAGANTSTQVELNKKREGELARMKTELDELNIAHEGMLAGLRQKHNSTMADLGEQIDSLNASKVKAEKEKSGIERDLADSRASLEDSIKSKAELDRTGKLLQGSIVENNQKLDELARTLNEADSSKKHLQVENQDLNRQIEELENAIANMNKTKVSLSTQLEDTRRLADAEIKDKSHLLSKCKGLSTDIETIKDKIESTHMQKSDLMKALSKAQSEIQLWKSRYETEGLGRVEELESSNTKLKARVGEAEETLDSLQTKIANVEKSKARITQELEDVAMDYERAHAAAIIIEKRTKNFDKVLGEWQVKASDLSAEVEASNNECRNYNSELFRVKAAQEEAVEHLDVVKRENKNLADEIRDLLEQLGDGGRSIHELDKQRRRLEMEKEELQGALEEAEGALEQEENKVLRAQLELGQAKQEIDRRVSEKEEEFENTRKNHARAMDSLNASLESEQRAKGEALRIKKKLEGTINELEIALDHANKANAEGMKTIKRYQGQLRDTIEAYESEARARQQVVEQVGITERKASALAGEMDESRALLDAAERSKRQLDIDLGDARNSINEMQNINSKEMAAKRALEGSLHTSQAEIDSLLLAAKNSEEKSKRAMVDAARLADELRAEQDHSNTELRNKKALESQLAEMETRLADTEDAAMRNGKAAMTKLEMKVRELEVELGNTQSHTSETSKAYHRSERKVKELLFAQEEDRKNQDRMSELANKLQQKIKTYKLQIEEAEEIAALNLAKFRKAQQELEETEDRAKMAENSINEVTMTRSFY